MRQLQRWNGRAMSIGLTGSIYIGAYTRKQAIELMTQVAGYSRGLS